MGRLTNLAQTFHEFVTVHVEESYVPAVASGNDGYDMSMNGIDVGEGQTEETYVIEPGTTERIETTATLETTRLDEWWVSHLQNG
jgi:LEA14-like dessication related protein